MRLTLIRHSISEGLRSIVRHPLVTLASVTTIALMLILLGAFTVFSINARHIMTTVGQQPPVEITLDIDVTADELAALDTALQTDSTVLEFLQYSPQQNFEKFKANMEDATLFEDFPVENFPYTYTVRLTDPSIGEAFQAQITGLPGVRNVSLELAVMTFLSQAIIWVNYATLIAFGVLSIISFFIISNMVRVAVFARGEEINIMKYVGATNWYIRVPYIIEGALVGLAGAILAWLVILLAYNQIYAFLMIGTKPTDFLTMVAASEISRLVLLINLLIGAGVGSLGSAISVRRHVRV
jgi:cell division transport system permease protein